VNPMQGNLRCSNPKLSPVENLPDATSACRMNGPVAMEMAGSIITSPKSKWTDRVSHGLRSKIEKMHMRVILLARS
jgi:hypothetical protein